MAELERRESLKLVYVGSNPTSVASRKDEGGRRKDEVKISALFILPTSSLAHAGVAQSGGGASLRN